MIIHKFREGSIDGLTQVYSHQIGKWLPISEVTELRTKINELDEMEENSASAASEAACSVPQEQMVFVADEDDQQVARREFEAYCEKMAAEVKAREGQLAHEA